MQKIIGNKAKALLALDLSPVCLGPPDFPGRPDLLVLLALGSAVVMYTTVLLYDYLACACLDLLAAVCALHKISILYSMTLADSMSTSLIITTSPTRTGPRTLRMITLFLPALSVTWHLTRQIPLVPCLPMILTTLAPTFIVYHRSFLKSLHSVSYLFYLLCSLAIVNDSNCCCRYR